MATFRWHHADRAVRNCLSFPGSSASEIAAGETNLESAFAYYWSNAHTSREYVGEHLERAAEFQSVMAQIHEFFRSSDDAQEVTLTSEPGEDAVCQLCIRHLGQAAHCFAQISPDGRAKRENAFALPFKEWIETDTERHELATFTEELVEPGQTIPSIIGHTTVGALRKYYNELRNGPEVTDSDALPDTCYPDTVPYTQLVPR